MKKRKNPDKIAGVTRQNPVAKFARQFNQARIFDDKTRYRRQAKHRKQEASLIVLPGMIKAAFCFHPANGPHPETANGLPCKPFGNFAAATPPRD